MGGSKRTKSFAYWTGLAVGGGVAIYLASVNLGADLAPANLAAKAALAAPAAAKAPDPILIGDASLRGEFDFSRRRLDGDQFVSKLPDGRTANLTLVPKIQASAEKVLEKSRAHEGAVVVMGLDGRLLAVAGRKNGKRDDRLPVEVWAPAASVFKLVTSAALLEAGVEPAQRVCYHGGVRDVLASNLVDSSARDKSCADFSAGLSRSQNAIIAKLAHRHLERDDLADTATRLGFAAAPDFALDVEPNRFDLPEDSLELARVAAGFWSTELSPVGAAVMTAAIANGGISVNPRLINSVEKKGDEKPVLPAPGERILDADVARALGAMMVETCTTGTARSAFRDPKGRPFLGGAKVAGKTGSLSRTSPEFRGYSWFVGYAPADEPVAVIAVLLANPAKWRLKAHTAARIVLQSVM